MSESFTGNIAQLALRDILKMLIAGGQTGRLELADGPARADIYLRSGAIVHAVAGPRTGEPAVVLLLNWSRGMFRFQPQVLSTEATVTRPYEQLLADAARQAAEREALARTIPSVAAIPFLAAGPPPGPVTLQPLEWQLIAKVDGRKTIVEIAEALGGEELAVVKALYRFVNAGLVTLSGQASPVQPQRRATVPPAFFQSLTSAVAAAMGPLAPIIVDDAIEALGAARDAFPRERLSALIEHIAGEIRDDAKRARFQQTMLTALRGMAA
jgi:hypothetical protein